MAQRPSCAYLAIKAASSFICNPTDHWKIPQFGNIFHKNKSMTEQHKKNGAALWNGCENGAKSK